MADETPVVETKVEDKAPEVDTAAIASTVKTDVLADIEAKFPELTADLSNKVKADIIKSITGEDKKGPWVPKSYDEIVDKSVEKFKDVLAEREKKAAEQTTSQVEEQKKTQAEWNNYWDAQMKDLEADGVIPALPKEIAAKLADGKALTAEERNDPAVQARSDIYAKSKELKDEGKRDWFNLELVALKHMGTRSRNDGRNAPVQSRNIGGASKGSDTFSHSYIRNNSTLKILHDALNEK
jgi:hypothetical protein